ncbi:MAG: hypothetical protein A2603_14330 [Bdellovibrionales bacterium RIFOXYD1_FULL_55_31]|nr:MAG: hypothetical protein A2603_14330 [Bdellovibrionales bacterium RIFOXYD1_FULL_55_31]
MALLNTSYHVLLIEDDPKQSELYAELIREVADCKVDVMSRAIDSSDWIGRSNYHLVVIDHNPAGGGVSGFILLEQIKRISPVTSVILIAERASIEQAVAAIRLGAEDYLKKPFNLETFQLAVKRGLDRKAVFGENAGASSFLNLLNSCQMISASLEQKKIFGIIQSYFSRELKCACSAVYTMDQEKLVRMDVRAKNDVNELSGQDKAMLEVLDIALHASNPLPGLAKQNETYRFIERGQMSPPLFVFRFQCSDPLDYYLVCLSPESPASVEAFDSRLRMLKAQIEVTGKNIAQYMGVHKLVYVDDATGLYNTRYLNYILEREISQARTSKKPFAVLFIDCDHFKLINDNHGHLVGTKILNELGAQIRKLVRETDIGFRYGGDEFVAVLSPCDLNTAKVVAERIRSSIEQELFLSNEGLNLHITVSIGVALFPDHAGSKQAIIDAADHAMYSAKRATRNAVTIAETPELPAPSSEVTNPPGAEAVPPKKKEASGA